jgi:endonuclease YncB( thermonuclease family)
MGRAIKFRRKSQIPLALIAGIGIAIGVGLGLALDLTPHEIARISLPSLSSFTPAHVTGVHFGVCYSGPGFNCVVDGDTFWMNGEKIRVADIDAPETHPPRCAHEADLGQRATNRLRQLLNQGPITLVPVDRDRDTYDRKLRIVTRDGRSLGWQLVDEGLARVWTGARRPWC